MNDIPAYQTLFYHHLFPHPKLRNVRYIANVGKKPSNLETNVLQPSYTSIHKLTILSHNLHQLLTKSFLVRPIPFHQSQSHVYWISIAPSCTGNLVFSFPVTSRPCFFFLSDMSLRLFYTHNDYINNCFFSVFPL